MDGQQVAGGASQEHRLESPAGGGSRTFLLHLPASYNPSESSPLILAFHGKGQKASQFEAQTQLSDPEYNHDAIVTYPQGIKNQWTGDPEAPPSNQRSDIRFAEDLLDHLTSHYSISPSHIYAVGFSNGGGLTDLLACNASLSSRIAAFAIASGAIYKDEALKNHEPLFSSCEPSRSPVPILELHGSKDPVIHYDGKTTPDGPTFSLPEWLQGWRERNKCPEDSEKKTMLYEDKVVRTAWGRDDEEVVVHYYIHGFGHGWPSTKPQDDDDQRYGPAVFDATPLILDFFKRHELPRLTS